MRILLVDDDEQLMEVLADHLIQERYAVDIASTGEMGWEFIQLFRYDLVVLDRMLPDEEGIELCHKIRAEGYQMPVMLLTARDGNYEVVAGLDAGADDYVVKPFDFEELTARIRALLRRDSQTTAPILLWHELKLNPKTHEVFCQEELLPFTPKEYALIELLMRHPQQVFSPSAIIDNLWAGEDAPGEEAVRTHIKGIRQKLTRAGMPKDTIDTVYGVGYRLKQRASNDAEHKQKVASAWTKVQKATENRIAILDNLLAAWKANCNDNKLLSEARSSAHKLAGSLGGFGFPEGSNLAKKIEQLLLEETISPRQKQKLGYLVAALKSELQQEPFAEKVTSALSQGSLVIIDRQCSCSQPLAAAARLKNIKVLVADTLAAAEKLLKDASSGSSAKREYPIAVIQAIAFPDGADLDFLARIHQQHPDLPVVIISEDAQLGDRLEIVRQGGSLILQAPVEPEVAIDAVLELVRERSHNAKVLLVDDDPQVLLSLEIMLQPWFQLVTLSELDSFWQVLEEFDPDLLVLDVEMPQLNGLELCQLLRSDRRWLALPVLFLTVDCNAKTEHRAFSVGADDYVCKPVVGVELAHRILNRLRRAHAHQASNQS